MAYRITDVVEHLQEILGNQFPDEVTHIYYGDIGIYPPSVFRGVNKEYEFVIVLDPSSDRLDRKSGRTAAGEFRDLGINIRVMTDMTPFFEALPTEAIRERALVTFVERISLFLQQIENVDLNHNVSTTTVGDVDYDWEQRGDLMLRRALIEYSTKVYVSRTAP